MTVVRWGWLAAGLLLAGCGPTVQEREAVAALRDPLARVTGFAELACAPLAFGVSTPFAIDGNGPVVEVPGVGRSYAQGFALPERVGEMRVIVSATFGGGGIFHPMVTALDAERRVLATTRLEDVREGNRPMAMLRSKQVQMFLGGELRRRARFVVVHTTGDVQLSGEPEPFQVAQRGPVFVPMPIYEGPPRPPRRAAVGASLTIELAAPLL